jgi:hypothetical protein
LSRVFTKEPQCLVTVAAQNDFIKLVTFFGRVDSDARSRTLDTCDCGIQLDMATAPPDGVDQSRYVNAGTARDRHPRWSVDDL